METSNQETQNNPMKAFVGKIGANGHFNQVMNALLATEDKSVYAKNYVWLCLFALTGSDKSVLKGSDLKLLAGDHPWFKRKKAGGWMRDERFPKITEDLMNEIFSYVIPDVYKTELVEQSKIGDQSVDHDFAVNLNFNAKFNKDDPKSLMFFVNDRMDISNTLARFRGNVFSSLGSKGFVFRIIEPEIPVFENMNLPRQILQFAKMEKGLVLVTGPTGSGKSTTLASLIDHINKTQNKHIVTIEDPVEFVYPNIKSTFTQRAVGGDTKTFATALRAGMREAPDIVLVGEMRDLETIKTALELAETGHLVFATLHTFNAAKTIDRIIQQFPANEQNQVAQQLASVLVGVVSQSLIYTAPDEAGKRGIRSLNEVIRMNNATRNDIREMKSASIIQSVSGDPRCLVMMDHAKELVIQKGVVLSSDIMELFNNQDPEMYAEFKAALNAAGKYMEDDDPVIKEDREKRRILNEERANGKQVGETQVSMRVEPTPPPKEKSSISLS